MKKIVKKFNNLIKNTIFKVQNKTNNKFQISSFNKYLISSISLLFIYLFYLLIPILYDKTWVQRNIESQLLEEFKINFSISSDISYRILPSPHFLIQDSKIFKEDNDKITSLSDIKNLKVFVTQGNFLNKEKTTLKYIKIDNANFSLSRDDFKLLNDNSNNKFSNKKIEINKSNIFFKDSSDETIAIIKISKAFLFFDDKNLLNLFNLRGEVFNLPFKFNLRKKFDSSHSENFNIKVKKLKLDIFNTSYKEKNNFIEGKNVISFLNSSINTNYKIDNGITTFDSKSSGINGKKVDYNGELSINPFTLNLNINLHNYKIFNLLNINSILTELIKTELLFNENISINTAITATSVSTKEIFQNAKINLDIINGKINFNKTKLINKRIGSLELENSNLFFENNQLILNSDILINIGNSKRLFSLLQTNKKFRKPIKDILINLDYNFLTNQIEFNNFKIDNKYASDELLTIIEGFSDIKSNNLNKSKRLLNQLFMNYEG